MAFCVCQLPSESPCLTTDLNEILAMCIPLWGSLLAECLADLAAWPADTNETVADCVQCGQNIQLVV